MQLEIYLTVFSTRNKSDKWGCSWRVVRWRRRRTMNNEKLKNSNRFDLNPQRKWPLERACIKPKSNCISINFHVDPTSCNLHFKIVFSGKNQFYSLLLLHQDEIIENCSFSFSNLTLRSGILSWELLQHFSIDAELIKSTIYMHIETFQKFPYCMFAFILHVRVDMWCNYFVLRCGSTYNKT